VPSYWVNTIARDHVTTGAAGSFTQAEHGRDTRLKRLAKGDYLVCYSPQTSYPGGDPVQAFTALGRVADDTPYRVEMAPDFRPWRRRVDYLASHPAPVRPLLERLSFIKDVRHWGYPFHRGLFEIPRDDFVLIAAAMGVTLPDS
jgi:hypothetical protein